MSIDLTAVDIEVYAGPGQKLEVLSLYWDDDDANKLIVDVMLKPCDHPGCEQEPIPQVSTLSFCHQHIDSHLADKLVPTSGS